jgi:predicted O-methyltransferase YrrM
MSQKQNILVRALKDPVRALRRVLHSADRYLLDRRLRRMVESEVRSQLLRFISEAFDVDGEAIHNEYQQSELRKWHEGRIEELRTYTKCSPFRTSSFDCESLYALVRAAKPDVMVETGVFVGTSSAHILAAMERNGSGKLYSVDLPSKPNHPPHGFWVQEEVKPRWELTVGDSRVELPVLFERLGMVDAFFHDSLHTFEHMTFEYEVAIKHLRPGALFLSHDSASSFLERNAFPVFCRKHGLDFWIAQVLGIAQIPKKK